MGERGSQLAAMVEFQQKSMSEAERRYSRRLARAT